MSRPYIPVLVEGITGLGPGLASAIGLVAGTAALVGALVSPLGGVIGDRIGFRPVLVAALGGAGVVLFLMPLGGVGRGARPAGRRARRGDGQRQLDDLRPARHRAPAERRSAALNLVYLPLYAAGIIGPAVGAVVASVSGVDGLFVVGWLRLPVRGADDPAATRPHRRAATGRQRAARDGEHASSLAAQPGRRRETTNPASTRATSEPPARASASRVSTNR